MTMQYSNSAIVALTIADPDVVVRAKKA